MNEVLIRGLGALLLLALAACGGGGGGGGPGADPSATHNVGAAGATIASPDGALQLTIPAGALGNATEIRIVEVTAANLPDHLRTLAPDRVYRLEPAGLQFSQAVQMTVTLPAGSEAAYALLDSNGVPEALGDTRLRFGAAGRTLSGTLRHFSHLIVDSVPGLKMEMMIDRTRLKVQEMLNIAVVVTRDAEDAITIKSTDLLHQGTIVVPNRSTPDIGDIPLGPMPARLELRFDMVCARIGIDEEVGYEIDFEHVGKAELVTAYGAARVDDLAPLIYPKLITDTTVECIADDPPPGPTGPQLRTGVFDVPKGMKPDGIEILRAPFANLPAYGDNASEAGYILIAGDKGALGIDPTTGDVALDMSSTSADFGIGDPNNLGVIGISANPRGPGADAALLASSRPHAFLRRWDPTASLWGFTEIQLSSGLLDAFLDTPRSGDANPELVTVSPTRGITRVRHSLDIGFRFDNSDLVTPMGLGGAPRSAAVLFDLEPILRSPYVALTRPSAGGDRNVVVAYDAMRTPKLAELFGFAGDGGRRLRCSINPFANGSKACGVTDAASGSLHLFWAHPDTLFEPKTPQTLGTGAGALGLNFGVRYDGGQFALVANFDDSSFNVVEFGADGQVSANRNLKVEGCDKIPHVVPFNYGGRHYAFGSCNANNRYFGIEIRF